MSLVNQLTERDIRLEFIKERLVCPGEDLPMAKLLLAVMGVFAEFE
jgi:DNA invertase Pin-like site-specific DNA recombinase